MTIRLLPGMVLSDSDNHQNLELTDWAALNAGLSITVEEIPPRLVGLVEEVTEDLEG